VADVYQSPYFNKELDRQSGYRTRSVLCGPIRNPSGQIIGAVQMLNKLPPAPGFSNQVSPPVVVSLSSVDSLLTIIHTPGY
jgi:hypothetical protein